MIVLAAPILKRRHLSVKRRQLVLTDGEARARNRRENRRVSSDRRRVGDECARTLMFQARCRLFYVDADAMELKGSIPWSAQMQVQTPEYR